jgi:hypothetical protein
MTRHEAALRTSVTVLLISLVLVGLRSFAPGPAADAPAAARRVTANGSPATTHAQESDMARSILGVWELVAEKDVRGRVTKDPRGMVVITDAGIYMRIDLPANRKMDKPDAELAAEELRARYQGAGSHYGTYKVTGNRLDVHVIASLDPNREGSQVVRTVRIDGDMLIVSAWNKPDVPAEDRFRRVHTVAGTLR